MPLGCSFDGGNRLGEDHDKIGTDRSSCGLVAGRSYVCHGSKWSTHWRISTSAVEPQSLRLLSSSLLSSSLLRPLSSSLSSLSRLLSPLKETAALAHSHNKRRVTHTCSRSRPSLDLTLPNYRKLKTTPGNHYRRSIIVIDMLAPSASRPPRPGWRSLLLGVAAIGVTSGWLYVATLITPDNLAGIIIACLTHSDNSCGEDFERLPR